MLPWPWCRLAALIPPLAWEFAYAASAALRRKKKMKFFVNWPVDFSSPIFNLLDVQEFLVSGGLVPIMQRYV